MGMTGAEKIVENKLLTLAARGSMLLAGPLMAAMVGLTGWYFSGQSEANERIAQRFVAIETNQATHDRDIALLKQAGTTDQLQRDRDQAEIKTQLDRLQASVSQLSTAVAGLTAVLDAERRSSPR